MADCASSAAAAEMQEKPPSGGGLLSRAWRNVFGGGGGGGGDEDEDKRLQSLCREKVSVKSRLRWRARTSRRVGRPFIALSLNLEFIAVIFFFVRSRSRDLSSQMKAVRVLPMFIIPALAAIIYSAFVCFKRMLDRRDQKKLDTLRAKMQEKIIELKERTADTQKHIQKHELGSTAMSAPALVESNTDKSWGESDDFEPAHSPRLRHRKPADGSSLTTNSNSLSQPINVPLSEHAINVHNVDNPNQSFLEQHNVLQTDLGRPVARDSALLLAEHPTQPFAVVDGESYSSSVAQEPPSKDDHGELLAGLQQPKEHEIDSSFAEETIPSLPDANNAYNISEDGPIATSSSAVIPPEEQGLSSSSRKETPTYPFGENNAHDKSVDPGSMSHSPVVISSRAVQEFPLGGGEEEALSMSQQPNRHEMASSFDEENWTSPSDGNNAQNNSDNLSLTAYGLIPLSSMVYQELLLEGGGEEMVNEATPTTPDDIVYNNSNTSSFSAHHPAVNSSQQPPLLDDKEEVSTRSQAEGHRMTSTFNRGMPQPPPDDPHTDNSSNSSSFIAYAVGESSSATVRERASAVGEESGLSRSLQPDEGAIASTSANETSASLAGDNSARSKVNTLLIKELPSVGGERSAFAGSQREEHDMASNFDKEIPKSAVHGHDAQNDANNMGSAATVEDLPEDDSEEKVDSEDKNASEIINADLWPLIDEPKERRDGIATQQQIERYKSEPAEKATSKTVIASKHEEDSGSEAHLGHETDSSWGDKTDYFKPADPPGLRHRKSLH